jgi:uncharacterized protein with von Willebrand factor type A (vWA) domain
VEDNIPVDDIRQTLDTAFGKRERLNMTANARIHDHPPSSTLYLDLFLNIFYFAIYMANANQNSSDPGGPKVAVVPQKKQCQGIRCGHSIATLAKLASQDAKVAQDNASKAKDLLNPDQVEAKDLLNTDQVAAIEHAARQAETAARIVESASDTVKELLKAAAAAQVAGYSKIHGDIIHQIEQAKQAAITSAIDAAEWKKKTQFGDKPEDEPKPLTARIIQTCPDYSKHLEKQKKIINKHTNNVTNELNKEKTNKAKNK